MTASFAIVDEKKASKSSAPSSEPTWEQRQLLLLEKQQNELELKLLKMQELITQKNVGPEAMAESLQMTMQETKTLSNQLTDLRADMQKEQEEMIKSIVLK